MATKTMKCTCEHYYQDAGCGPGQRIHVLQADGSFRCSICGALKDSKGKPFKPAEAAEPERAEEKPAQAPEA